MSSSSSWRFAGVMSTTSPDWVEYRVQSARTEEQRQFSDDSRHGTPTRTATNSSSTRPKRGKGGKKQAYSSHIHTQDRALGHGMCVRESRDQPPSKIDGLAGKTLSFRRTSIKEMASGGWGSVDAHPTVAAVPQWTPHYRTRISHASMRKPIGSTHSSRSQFSRTRQTNKNRRTLTSFAGPLGVQAQGSVRVLDEHARALLGGVERVLAVALGVEKRLREGRIGKPEGRRAGRGQPVLECAASQGERTTSSRSK